MIDKGKHLDLLSGEAGERPETPSAEKPFLGVNFACCGVYARVYRNAEQSAYVGSCPRCAQKVRFEIGPGGSDSRFFTVL